MANNEDAIDLMRENARLKTLVDNLSQDFTDAEKRLARAERVIEAAKATNLDCTWGIGRERGTCIKCHREHPCPQCRLLAALDAAKEAT